VTPRQHVLLLLLVIAPALLSTPALSYSIDRLWVDWNGHEVKTISPTASLSDARILLQLTPDIKDCFDAAKYRNDVCTISIDASSLSSDPSTKATLARLTLGVRADCAPQGDGSYLCKSDLFSLSSSQQSNPVKVSMKVGTQRTNQDFMVALVIDATRPAASAIRTRYCEGDVCYATNDPTPFTVEFTDTVTAFDYHLVFVGAQGQSLLATAASCTGRTCSGTIALPCSKAGQEFTLALTSVQGVSTREDAMNLATPEATQRVVCAVRKPDLLEWKTPVADGVAGQAVNSGSIIYQAKVRSYAGPAFGAIDTSNISEHDQTPATCAVASDSLDKSVYTCTWQVSDLLPGSKRLDVTITDAVGNAVVKGVPLIVLNLTRTNKSINFYSIKMGEVLPAEINRMALDLAAKNYLPYPSYVTYNLAAKKSTARVVHQELSQCWYKLPNETGYNNSGRYNLFSRDEKESRVLYPSRDAKQTNRLNLQIRADKDVLALSDAFDVTCQVDLAVAEGNRMYADPERENLTFTIRLREAALGQPGAAFVSKIKSTEDSLQGGGSKFLLNLRKVRATLDGVCTIMENVQGLDATGNILVATGTGLINTGWLASAGKLMQTGGNKIVGPIEGFLNSAWENKDTKQAGFLKKVCKQVNCRGVDDYYSGGGSVAQLQAGVNSLDKSWTDILPKGDVNSASAGSYWTGQLTENAGATDFRNSFIMSALHMCVGGMIYNAGKWQDINCGYLQCLKDQSLQGGSVAVCEQGKSYKLCTQVVGEVFELPFARVIKNIGANINSVIQNLPGMLMKWGFNAACKPYITPMSVPCEGVNWQCVGCHLSNAVMHVVDYSKETKQVFTAPLVDDNICLQALCNDKNSASCPRSFNKAESWTTYSNYLRYNTWINNEQKRTAPAPKQTEDVKALFKELDGKTFSYTPGRDEYGENGVLVYNSAQDVTDKKNYNIELSQRLNTYIDSLHVDRKNFITSPADYIAAGKQGIVITNAQQLNAYKSNTNNIQNMNLPAGTTPDDWDKMNAASALYDKIKTCQTSCDIGGVTYTYIKETKTWSCGDISDCLFKTGVTEEEINQLAAQRDLVNGQLFGTLDSAKAMLNYQACTKPGSNCAAEALKALEARGITLVKDTYYMKKLVSESSMPRPTECKDIPICTLASGKTYRCKDNSCEEVVALSKEQASSAASMVKAVSFYATLDLFANIAVAWAQDHGYLDWLAISNYGEWGRAVTDKSKMYISPEGWKQNICNDVVFDVDDSDNGAIYEPTSGGGISPVGSFGTEIRTIENESGTFYAYITVVSVTNPQRPVGQGHKLGDGLYDYKLDLSFRDPDPTTCLDTCPTNSFDLVNGTYNLTEGKSFGSPDSPKRSAIYLPVKYKRVCLTFDKTFPSSTFGKPTYCRAITENVFHTGSPVQAGASGGRYTTTPGTNSGGDGSLAGEI